MSFNSLDSNTSPHSWHSTYSDSSSRETILTLGCLHCSGVSFFSEDGDCRLNVINLATVEPCEEIGFPPEIPAILRRLAQDVKYDRTPFQDHREPPTKPMKRQGTRYHQAFGLRCFLRVPSCRWWSTISPLPPLSAHCSAGEIVLFSRLNI
jgi:hypothetical protein